MSSHESHLPRIRWLARAGKTRAQIFESLSRDGVQISLETVRRIIRRYEISVRSVHDLGQSRLVREGKKW